jgi:UDP-GlcNAc:undecaprenyl-phosphate/decaprenyl-phosphate GlcNAc-1-phosphate transferase
MLSLASSFILTLALIPVVIKYSYRKGLLDHPKPGSVHTRPVPMTGGIVVFCVFFLMAFLLDARHNLVQLLIASVPMLLGGLYDDRKGLNATQKLLLQSVSVLILMASGVMITKLKLPAGGILDITYFSIPVTMLWLLFMTNLVNLLDGLDGLAAGEGIIVLSVLYIIMNPSLYDCQLLIFVGALSAFLIFNFYPARIFLGNNGSSFLGFAIGYFSLVTSQKSSVLPILIVPPCILMIHVLDVGYSVLRRAVKGEKIFKGDRGHIHHILLGSIKNHKVTVLAFYLISLLLAAVVLKIYLRVLP